MYKLKFLLLILLVIGINLYSDESSQLNTKLLNSFEKNVESNSFYSNTHTFSQDLKLKLGFYYELIKDIEPIEPIQEDISSFFLVKDEIDFVKKLEPCMQWKLIAFYKKNSIDKHVSEISGQNIESLNIVDRKIVNLMLSRHQKWFLDNRVKSRKKFEENELNLQGIKVKGLSSKELNALSRLWRIIETLKSREVIISEFDSFKNDFPDSKYLPQLLVKIGNLYSTGLRCDWKRNNSIADKYYRKAKRLYGSKFSYELINLWGTLVNRSVDPLKEGIEYIKWMNSLKAGKSEDVCSIRPFKVAINKSSIYYSEEEKSVIIEWLKNNNINSYYNCALQNVSHKTGKKVEAIEELVKATLNKDKSLASASVSEKVKKEIVGKKNSLFITLTVVLSIAMLMLALLAFFKLKGSSKESVKKSASQNYD